MPHPSRQPPPDAHTLELRAILAASSVTLDGRQAVVVGSPADPFAEVRDLHDGRREHFGWDVLRLAVHNQHGNLMSATIPPIDLPGSPDRAE